MYVDDVYYSGFGFVVFGVFFGNGWLVVIVVVFIENELWEVEMCGFGKLLGFVE